MELAEGQPEAKIFRCMARFFRYKTPAALTSEAAHLGHTLSLSQRYEALFQPIAIGPKRCGNRLAVQPMEGCDGTLDGRPDELTFRRYVRFGSGGAKLIWGEATAISDEGVRNPASALALRPNSRVDRGHAEPLPPRSSRSVRQCRRFGDRSATHALGPLRISPHAPGFTRSYPRSAHDRQGERPAGRRLLSARRRRGPRSDRRPICRRRTPRGPKFGVDFIDLKQCHGYLLSELLAARNRPGRFGGSFENRTRLVREIVARIREELPSLIVATRFNAYDGIAYRKGTVGGRR